MRCSISRSFHIGSGIVYIRSHSVVFLEFFQLVCAAIVGGSALPMGKKRGIFRRSTILYIYYRIEFRACILERKSTEIYFVNVKNFYRILE